MFKCSFSECISCLFNRGVSEHEDIGANGKQSFSNIMVSSSRMFAWEFIGVLFVLGSKKGEVEVL